MFQIITLPLFLLLCCAAVASSKWALVLVALMFGIEQSLQTSSPTFLDKTWLANVCVGVSVALSVVRVLATKPGSMRGYFTTMWVGVMVLYAWWLVSLVWTPSTEGALDILSKNYPYFGLLIVLAPLLLNDIEDVAAFGRALLYSGILVVLTLVLNPEFGMWSGRMGLVVGGKLITSPLAIGELGGTLIILAALIRTGPAPALLATARVAAFILGAILALQSGSRGQLVFAVAMAVAFYPISKKVKSIPAFFGSAIIVGAAGAGVFMLAGQILHGFALERWGSGQLDEGFQHRLSNASELVAAFITNPIAWFMGLGANAFRSLNAVAAKDEYPHNVPVEVLCELGIPMFAVFVGLIVLALRDGMTLFRRFASSPGERVGLAVLFALTAYQFCLANKQSNLWGNGMLFFFLLLVARLQVRSAPQAGELEHEGEYTEHDDWVHQDGASPSQDLDPETHHGDHQPTPGRA